MKNREVVSAAIGGVFFAVPYLALSLPILPSLAIGAAAFGAGELVFGDYKLTLKETNRSLYQILEDAKRKNKHIVDMIPMIENVEIQKEIKWSLTKALDGAAKGAVAGATFGSLIPVVGPIVGATVGAVLGFLGGLIE